MVGHATPITSPQCICCGSLVRGFFLLNHFFHLFFIHFPQCICCSSLVRVFCAGVLGGRVFGGAAWCGLVCSRLVVCLLFRWTHDKHTTRDRQKHNQKKDRDRHTTRQTGKNTTKKRTENKRYTTRRGHASTIARLPSSILGISHLSLGRDTSGQLFV